MKTVFFRAGGMPCDPDALGKEVREEEIDFLRGYTQAYVPMLSGTCLATDVCMYTNTPDEHFIVDVHPDHPQVSFASPCSGHGYKFAPVMAEILADLATEGATGHPIGMFSPHRFQSMQETA